MPHNTDYMIVLLLISILFKEQLFDIFGKIGYTLCILIALFLLFFV